MAPNIHERTYIMVKVRMTLSASDTAQIEPSRQPDGVDRGLVGEILTRFEKRGFKLIAAKLALPSKEHLENRAFLLPPPHIASDLISPRLRRRLCRSQGKAILPGLDQVHADRPRVLHGL